MSRIKSVDMLNGNLFKSIIVFGVPLLFVGLIQNLFNAVDIMVLGYLADTEAVAAVGATSSIIHLLVNIAFGVSNGAKIILSRLMGEGEEKKTEQTVFTSIATAVMLGLLVVVIGIVFSGWFLGLTKCPENIFGDALTYLRIYFAAAPAIMIYNFGSNILQVSGDSQRPLYYMLLSGALNIILNVVLCLVMTEKVAAVAIATAASQVLGAALVMIRLCRMEGSCRFRLRGAKWHSGIFVKLMSNGLPIGLSSSLYSLANLQIQSAVNSFGSAAIAGNSAMSSLETIEAAVVSTPWATAAGVFAGKNLGADKRERVKGSILYCLGITVVSGLIMSAVITAFSTPLLSLYVNDADAVAYGQIRMLYTTLPYVIACVNGILAHVIQSFGYSIYSTVNSIVSVLLFRIFWMQVLFPKNPTFHMLMLCFLVSWILVAVVNVTVFTYLYFAKFSKGKIKKMG